MLLHACGVFQALPSRLGGLQEPPGASRGLQGLQGSRRGSGPVNEKCARRVPPEPRIWARLKFHAGWSGWTRPPTMGEGGGGLARLRCVCKGQ